MTRRIVLGILIALLLVAGAVTVGVYAYQFGVVQGLAQSDKIQVVAPPEAGTGIVPSYSYGWGGRFFFHPFGFLDALASCSHCCSSSCLLAWCAGCCGVGGGAEAGAIMVGAVKRVCRPHLKSGTVALMARARKRQNRNRVGSLGL